MNLSRACIAGRALLVALPAILFATSGCSIKRLAVNKLGDALAGGGTTFAADDDPELVKAQIESAHRQTLHLKSASGAALSLKPLPYALPE